MSQGKHFDLKKLFYFCSTSTDGLPVSLGSRPLIESEPDYFNKLQIKYLGAAGYFIKFAECSILTAPFFSNPSLLQIAFRQIQSDESEVDRWLSSLSEALKEIEAILVSHCHYDHLMDVPFLAGKYCAAAKIYGNKTMKHILSSLPCSAKTVALNDTAGTSSKMGTWHYTCGGRIRFMAIESEHSPMLFGIKFFTGRYESDLESVPTRAKQWLEGQVFAFLIDFLDGNGEVKFRIHYQDAASPLPCRFPPTNDGKRVDVAIVCLPGFDQVTGYPEEVMKALQPRLVILGHWENLFCRLPEDSKDLRVVATLDVKEFTRRLKSVCCADTRFEMPAPGAWLIY